MLWQCCAPAAVLGSAPLAECTLVPALRKVAKMACGCAPTKSLLAVSGHGNKEAIDIICDSLDFSHDFRACTRKHRQARGYLVAKPSVRKADGHLNSHLKRRVKASTLKHRGTLTLERTHSQGMHTHTMACMRVHACRYFSMHVQASHRHKRRRGQTTPSLGFAGV